MIWSSNDLERRWCVLFEGNCSNGLFTVAILFWYSIAISIVVCQQHNLEQEVNFVSHVLFSIFQNRRREQTIREWEELLELAFGSREALWRRRGPRGPAKSGSGTASQCGSRSSAGSSSRNFAPSNRRTRYVPTPDGPKRALSCDIFALPLII